jgi:RNA polymerase sigma factor (sigma-70 family)
MAAGLTSDTFANLLLRLDSDQNRAGEQYEELRRKLIRFFEWRLAPFPEDHADEVFNRLAKRLAEGVAVRNPGTYCYEIARLVLLEALRSRDSRRASLDDVNVGVVEEGADEAEQRETCLACLDDCLRALPENGRELIVEYYQDDKRDRITSRKELAARLGLKREALANRAQRLRDKLEQCVTRCVAKKISI